jgi:hypothetical protein
VDAYNEDVKPSLSPRDKLGAQPIFGFAGTYGLIATMRIGPALHSSLGFSSQTWKILM